MKKFFRFALAAIAIAAVAVACEDKNDPNEGGKNEEPENVKEGWEGDWGVIGDFNGWAGDVEMKDAGNGWYVAEEVEIAGGTLEFKFRRDKTWGDYEYGIETAGVVELDKEIKLKAKGANLKVEEPGIYKMSIQPNKELAKIEYVGAAAKIKIDGNFDDWADIQGVTLDPEEGSYIDFRATSDELYIYFYSKRTTARRDDLWGGAGYFYYCFDIDNDPTTGIELWGNGPYECLMALFPFQGTKDEPVIAFPDPEAADQNTVVPEGLTLDGAKVAGQVVEDGVITEIAVLRTSVPALPKTPITIETWGIKSANHLTLEVAL